MDTKKIIEHLRQGLWDCFAAAGGDTDGDKTPAALKSDIVDLALDCVKDLRKEYDELLCQSAELDRLRAVNAELLKDAERYRWLRNRIEVRNQSALSGAFRPALHVRHGQEFFDTPTKGDAGYVNPQHYAAECEQLDAAIDRAIAAAEQSTGEKA